MTTLSSGCTYRGRTYQKKKLFVHVQVGRLGTLPLSAPQGEVSLNRKLLHTPPNQRSCSLKTKYLGFAQERHSENEPESPHLLLRIPGPNGATPHYHTTPRPATNTSMPAPTHAAILMHLLHSVHAKLRDVGLNSTTAASQDKTTRAYLRQLKKYFNSGTNHGHTATNAPRRLLND